MKFNLICVVFVLSLKCIYAQNISYSDWNDERVDSLLNRHIKINASKKGIAGFRVQIHHDQSQSREDSQKFRAKFANDFPSLKTYLEYKSPYYKIQIGNFITRLEAFKVQRKISGKYKGSYIVPAYIEYEECTKDFLE